MGCTTLVTVNGQASNSVSFTISTSSDAPLITKITPESALRRQEVTIEGQRFGSVQSNSELRLGELIVQSTDIVSWSDTKIIAKVPANGFPGSVSHTVFDHTSIIKTILLRFCREKDGSIPDMGKRVAAANDLGDLLVLPRPRPISTRLVPARLLNHVARWQARAWKSKILTQMKESRRQRKLSEFQEGLAAARRWLAEPR
jgi:hypothetical protein